jgi:hypothetical protein
LLAINCLVISWNTHSPEVGLQESLVHALLSLHTLGVLMHNPVSLLQLSVVHALLSSQLFRVNTHFPVALSHLSVVHALLSLHTTVDNTHFPVSISQDPVLHWSGPEQSLGVNWHPLIGQQVSMVHGLLSSQIIALVIKVPVAWSQV